MARPNWAFFSSEINVRARVFQHEYDHLEGILISDYLFEILLTVCEVFIIL